MDIKYKIVELNVHCTAEGMNTTMNTTQNPPPVFIFVVRLNHVEIKLPALPRELVRLSVHVQIYRLHHGLQPVK